MPKKVTSDHGEIIHFAGRHHLFPVARATERAAVRLASAGDVRNDEMRIGWPLYFRNFIDRRLVFLYDETSGQGQAATRAEAASQATEGPAGPAGEASAQATST
jgi:hypothetical protein